MPVSRVMDVRPGIRPTPMTVAPTVMSIAPTKVERTVAVRVDDRPLLECPSRRIVNKPLRRRPVRSGHQSGNDERKKVTSSHTRPPRSMLYLRVHEQRWAGSASSDPSSAVKAALSPRCPEDHIWIWSRKGTH